MVARKSPPKHSGPPPWLVFAASLLGAPVVSIAAAYIASEINIARMEERVITIQTNIAGISASAGQRRAENDHRFEVLENFARESSVNRAGMGVKLESLQRDLEAAERRSNERIANVIEAVRRLQDRMGGRSGGDEDIEIAPNVGRAILRLNPENVPLLDELK